MTMAPTTEALQVGRFRVRTVEAGTFRLDGGAMFGSVPRTLWEKRQAPDALNRILLATRLLWIEEEGAGGRRVLVDTGNGQKFDERFREIFAIESRPPGEWGLPLDDLTDVVLTHLHFDHAGGVTRRSGDGTALEPSFPGARVHLQRANLDNARDPWERERASYLPENFEPLATADLHLVEGPAELLPDLRVEVADGHTIGLQWLLVGSGEGAVAYPADLIPTSSHLHLPWIMGYDRCAETTYREKRRFLERAVAGRWVVVFEHDPEISAATIRRDERGRFALDEVMKF